MSTLVYRRPPSKLRVYRTPKIETEVLRLQAQGWSQNRIAREIGISQSTVQRILKDEHGSTSHQSRQTTRGLK